MLDVQRPAVGWIGQAHWRKSIANATESHYDLLDGRWSEAVSKVTEPHIAGIDEGEAQQELVVPSLAIASVDLLQGHRELLIHHAGQTYRLRLTGTNKLILMK